MLSRVRCGVSGMPRTTTATTPPSERKALGWLTSRATYARHRVFLVARWSIYTASIPGGGNRRVILPRPRRLWRSTSSQSASMIAWRRTADSRVAAPGSRVVRAWRTRWVRSRWCLAHSPVRRAHTLGRLRLPVDEPHPKQGRSPQRKK